MAYAIVHETGRVTVQGTELLVPLVRDASASKDASAVSAAEASDAADAAALSAGTALAASGPTYANTTAGLAGTTNGQTFAVDNGDGTVTIYLNDGGVAVEQRSLPTAAFMDAALAARSTDLVVSGFDKFKMAVCIPRQPAAGGGFYNISDSAHEPGNITGPLTIVGRNLVINYGFTADKIGTFIMTPDEWGVGLGLTCGASVATDKATVSFAAPMHLFANLSSVGTSSGTAGLTIPSLFTGDATAIKAAPDVTITHPTCGSASNTPMVAAMFQAADVVAWDVRCINYTATTVVLATFIDFTFTVSWNGSAWVVTTPMNVAPTAVFAAGVLTVSFNQNLPSNMLYAQMNAPYHATVKDVKRNGNMAVGSIPLSFLDSAGAILTTEQAGMTATVSIPVKVKAATPLGRAGVLRPNVSTSAANIKDDNENFWVYLLHKMAP